MRVYQFTEQPYFPAWFSHDGSLRVNLPNARQDPKIAADLLHRYYDEWLLADELGLDIMVNEHHATATCMSCTAIVALSVLARQTSRARLLVLGYPIGHRPDPLRCAEELATIDVLSRGRLDMGFVKGVPYEFPVSNQNAVGVMERFWEAHDFIIKAMGNAINLDKISISGPISLVRDITCSEHQASRPRGPALTTRFSTSQDIGRIAVLDVDPAFVRTPIWPLLHRSVHPRPHLGLADPLTAVPYVP
jgi:alkanesulfonate monooxygenase SsuD/methylene tetrahydromethanopterin reductase-like flavin-dependent oxidoreductase (luciferase family)